tara:strand:+ start:3896 stop:4225 length:330 start_codon:yes stop_codon:yes gene_type:complete
MPTIEISFAQNLNTSVQASDMAWVSNVQASGILDEPTLLGEIVSVQTNTLTVQTQGATVIQGMFLLFSKPININESGLKGYYADVTFKNGSKNRAKLFAISSEAVISSK